MVVAFTDRAVSWAPLIKLLACEPCGAIILPKNCTYDWTYHLIQRKQYLLSTHGMISACSTVPQTAQVPK